LASARRRDGTPIYTIPIIFCPHCSSYISNSLDVAIHIDRAFQSTPKVFSEGPSNDALVRVWDDRWIELVGFRNIMMLSIMPNYVQLPPRSAAHYRAVRERIFKTPLEQQAPPDKLLVLWKNLRAGLTRISGYIPVRWRFVEGGESPTFPDFIMAGWLVWLKRLYGQGSKEWQELETWDEGRWGRLMRAFEQWEYTDEMASATVKTRL